MSQIFWEFSYNKSVKDYEDISLFTFEADLGEGIKNVPVTSIGIAKAMAENSPQVEDFAMRYPEAESYTYTLEGEDRQFSENTDFVSNSYAALLSLDIVEGSLERFKEPNTVLISESQAQKLFPNESSIGKLIIRDKHQLESREEARVKLTIVGVYKDMPSNFSFGNNILDKIDFFRDNNNSWNFMTIFKIKEGANSSTAYKPAMDKFVEIMNSDPNSSISTKNIKFIPLDELYYTEVVFMPGAGNKQQAIILIAVAILVIGIAVINYTNFFMALVPIRIKSVNLNKVFGAPTGVLKWNFIFETLGIMLLSFFLSLGVVHFLSQSDLFNFSSASLSLKDNLNVVLFAAAIVVCVSIVSGAFPAYYITKFSPALVLKGTFGRSKAGNKLRTLLTTIQFAISIALVVVASFVVLQNHYLKDIDYGYNRERLITADISPKMMENASIIEQGVAQSTLLENFAFIRTSMTSDLVSTWGSQLNDSEEDISFKAILGDWRFPEFIGVKLIEGRYFNQQDVDSDVATVIFNEAAVKAYGIKVGDKIAGGYPVVGIVKDFNYASAHDIIAPACLIFDPTLRHGVLESVNFRVSPSVSKSDALKEIESILIKADPSVDISTLNVRDYDEVINALYSQENKTAGFISVFALISILISLLGVFGMIVFEMQYRRKEVAVRKIFGSSVEQIILIFNRTIIYTLVISAIIALPIAWYVVKLWLSNFAYQTPIYWWIFLSSVLVVALIVLLVVNLQTYKAANENPVENLQG